MLLKIALAFALGSLGLILLQQRAERADEAELQELVEVQLQRLRAHLFRCPAAAAI
ncbi:MAG TPA: hypothetical protein VND20_08760 [Candidatus Binataceae bacterium]|nr:hypothetical protein [Candidatus Binataceae bacterium]HVC44893.1 hypothetical protein [Candidatus Binataceae bacterium]